MSRTRTLIYETRGRDGLSLADLNSLVRDSLALLGTTHDYALRDVHPVIVTTAPRSGYSPARPAGIRRIRVTL